MGCVLQPGEDLPTSALQPGQTTSDSVQPGQDIDVCVVGPAPVPLVVGFDLGLYALLYDAFPAPSGIVGVIFENDGTITITEDGFPAGTVGTWYTGDTPPFVQDDYDFMYDQQNAFAPNQGNDVVNLWVPGLGHGGNMAEWGYEPASFGPPEIADAIIRVRDAGTMIEIDNTQLTLQVTI